MTDQEFYQALVKEEGKILSVQKALSILIDFYARNNTQFEQKAADNIKVEIPESVLQKLDEEELQILKQLGQIPQDKGLEEIPDCEKVDFENETSIGESYSEDKLKEITKILNVDDEGYKTEMEKNKKFWEEKIKKSPPPTKKRYDNKGFLNPTNEEVQSIFEENTGALTASKIKSLLEQKLKEQVGQASVYGPINILIKEGIVTRVKSSRPMQWKLKKKVQSVTVPNENVIVTSSKKSKKVNSVQISKIPIRSIATQMYATDMDRIHFAREMGYKTIDEAVSEIGTWEFERKLKAWKTNNQ